MGRQKAFSETRALNIDAVKVIGLIFLYLTHSSLFQQAPQINNILQTYLDTAFMFLAGYLCKISLENREYKFTNFWKNKLKTFLIPFWIIIAIWYLTQRMPLRPATSFIAYGLGLRILALPPEWDLFSLWFASCLISYFLILSITGKHKKLRILTILSIIILASIHFSTIYIENWLINWTFFYYLLPFTAGFFWRFSFSSRRNLIFLPAILLIGIDWISLPIAGNFGLFLSIVATWSISLFCGLGLVLLSLYAFSKINHKGLSRVLAWIASGSLIAYLMEPIIGMWTGILLFPQLSGGILTNASIQFSLSPGQSITRLLLALPVGLLLSPAFYKGYLRVCRAINSSCQRN